MKVIIDGKEYRQPECHCKGVGHTCYLRPMPQKTNISIDKIKLKTGGSLISPKGEANT